MFSCRLWQRNRRISSESQFAGSIDHGFKTTDVIGFGCGCYQAVTPNRIPLEHILQLVGQLDPRNSPGFPLRPKVNWSTGQTVKIVVLRLSCAVRPDLLSVLYFPFREMIPI